MSVVGQPLYAEEWPGGPRGCRRRRPSCSGEGCDACDACDLLDACDGCFLVLLGFLRLLLSGRSVAAGPVPAVMLVDPTLPRTTRWVLAVLRWYKRSISARTPAVCRFTPSCSAYAAESVRRHGWRRGSVLAWRRLRRCRPHGPRGADPVP